MSKYVPCMFYLLLRVYKGLKISFHVLWPEMSVLRHCLPHMRQLRRGMRIIRRNVRCPFGGDK